MKTRFPGIYPRLTNQSRLENRMIHLLKIRHKIWHKMCFQNFKIFKCEFWEPVTVSAVRIPGGYGNRKVFHGRNTSRSQIWWGSHTPFTQCVGFLSQLVWSSVGKCSKDHYCIDIDCLGYVVCYEVWTTDASLSDFTPTAMLKFENLFSKLKEDFPALGPSRAIVLCLGGLWGSTAFS